jgi:hypothetical protein
LRSTALAIRLPGGLRDLLEATRHIILFNDLHPCAVQIRARCRAAAVSLIEEGTGLHRGRPQGRLSARRWLTAMLVPGSNLSGRQGESPWIETLWVTQTESLTPAHRRKRIVTFDRGAIITEIRRRWGTRPDLPHDNRPLLLLVGQPFVEDGVLTRRQLDAMLDAVSAAVPDEARCRVVIAYKPHPREQAPGRSASRVFGDEVLILDRDAPLETMDFEGRRVFLLSFTSGAVRGLTDNWRRVSAAACFPALMPEIGSASSFGGVMFPRDLSQLRSEITTFIASTPHPPDAARPDPS